MIFFCGGGGGEFSLYLFYLWINLLAIYVLDVTDKVRVKKKKPKVAQPKELFPIKNAGNTKENTRSPLSTRTLDMNSPAKLVQRKQIKDLDKKMTCSQENSLSRFIVRDKENMWLFVGHVCVNLYSLSTFCPHEMNFFSFCLDLVWILQSGYWLIAPIINR